MLLLSAAVCVAGTKSAASVGVNKLSRRLKSSWIVTEPLGIDKHRGSKFERQLATDFKDDCWREPTAMGPVYEPSRLNTVADQSPRRS